jgi:hypothetical protein
MLSPALLLIQFQEVGEIVDLTELTLGHITRRAAISVMLENIFVHAGEISCLKGLQGLTGYVI